MTANFLWYTGATAGVGDLVAPFTIMSGEMNSLATTSIIVSSSHGTGGLFTAASMGYGQMAELWWTAGQSVSVVAGSNIAGWFLVSPDAGTFLEQKTKVPPRGPDFIIPLPAVASTLGHYKAQGSVMLPAFNFFVLVQNNTDQTINATGNYLTVAPFAAQY